MIFIRTSKLLEDLALKSDAGLGLASGLDKILNSAFS